MSETLFSIVVPVYKVETFLVECIESLINQTYRDIEIILVDDGSPDKCPDICDEYASKDSRIRVIHKTNGGLVSARKCGAKEANGDYVLCVDGDDWVDLKYIERFAEIVENSHPDIIVCGYVMAFPDSIIKKPPSYENGFYSKDRMLSEIFPHLIQDSCARYFPPSLWAKAFKKELYIEMQQMVDERIKIGEDSACVLPSLYRANSIYITSDCHYYYRQNPASMTKDKRAFAWDGPELIHRHLINTIDLSQFDFQAQLSRKTTHELFSVVVSQFYRREPYRVVVKDIKEHLNSEIYSSAVKQCKFDNSKAKIMRFALRYKIMWLIWLYSRLK